MSGRPCLLLGEWLEGQGFAGGFFEELTGERKSKATGEEGGEVGMQSRSGIPPRGSRKPEAHAVSGTFRCLFEGFAYVVAGREIMPLLVALLTGNKYLGMACIGNRIRGARYERRFVASNPGNLRTRV